MKKYVQFFLPVVFLLAACGSSKVTNSYTANSASKIKYKKVMVVALLTDKNKSLQLQMEKELAESLAAQGVETITASQEFGANSFQNMKEKAVLKQLKNTNVDGVITISLLNKEKETNYVPGRVDFYPTPTYIRRGGFWGYYGSYYNRVYTPGYYDQSTTYFFETNLYDVAGNRLLYSAQSESFDPSSSEKMASTQAKVIVKDMIKNNVIGK